MSGNIRLGEDTRSGAIPLETLESSPVKPNSSFWALFFFKKQPPPREKSQPEGCHPRTAHVSGCVGRELAGPSPFPAALGGFGGAFQLESPPPGKRFLRL